MVLPKNKKIYFASDQHFGAPNGKESRIRELKFINWLDTVAKDAHALYLLGDLFDFWIEYKKVVPKGFVRVLGKLAELADGGIRIHYFVGNHDLWMQDYFQAELNIPIYHEPLEMIWNNKTFLIGHGDGLGPGDNGYKRMKRVFTNPLAQALFRCLPTRWGIGLGQYLSLKNKMISGEETPNFLGNDKEWLVHYCQEKEKEKKRHYYIFGHRHLPLKVSTSGGATYFNLGDWIKHDTYVVFDGNKSELKTWTPTYD